MNHAASYWTSEGRAEVDFIIQINQQIIPIEVKSDRSLRSKSLSVYNEKYKPKLRVRCSAYNLKQDGNLLNVPLFMADKVIDIIKKVMTNYV